MAEVFEGTPPGTTRMSMDDWMRAATKHKNDSIMLFIDLHSAAHVIFQAVDDGLATAKSRSKRMYYRLLMEFPYQHSDITCSTAGLSKI